MGSDSGYGGSTFGRYVQCVSQYPDVQAYLPLAGTLTALGGWYLARKGADEQNP